MSREGEPIPPGFIEAAHHFTQARLASNPRVFDRHFTQGWNLILPMVQRIARRNTVNHMAAEDAVSRTSLKLLQATRRESTEPIGFKLVLRIARFSATDVFHDTNKHWDREGVEFTEANDVRVEPAVDDEILDTIEAQNAHTQMRHRLERLAKLAEHHPSSRPMWPGIIRQFAAGTYRSGDIAKALRTRDSVVRRELHRMRESDLFDTPLYRCYVAEQLNLFDAANPAMCVA